ncbi:hypothetical protein [Flavobacterium haoranii]|uniref:Activator of Hsp90 ATPase homolog 1-like protein n=1 Tax=Flavobacterium haoranii TaxID=683124 RepID=A0A1M6KWR4_9FLAO|nr:hypothetical protein [Flavobacterium haoranii]SHJ63408.1 hypothetical protein SAMN05444337_2318 [Flavobacterium haoranii]
MKQITFSTTINAPAEKVWTEFTSFNGKTLVSGNFEPEQTHSIYM